MNAKRKVNVCSKCSYEWTARVDKPVACPQCKRYKWDEENKQT